jgi:hypothetical protein
MVAIRVNIRLTHETLSSLDSGLRELEAH